MLYTVASVNEWAESIRALFELSNVAAPVGPLAAIPALPCPPESTELTRLIVSPPALKRKPVELSAGEPKKRQYGGEPWPSSRKHPP